MLLVENFIALFLDSAPWLLLGLILAGVLKSFVPMSWMQKQLGGKGSKPIFKAALLGAPLPLCSCGVIPAAIGLRRAGASKSATTSFLVSTPETGIDSISVSYAMLGPFMAVIRPIAAISSAVVAGLLVGRDKEELPPLASTETTNQPNCKSKVETSSCCSTKDAVIQKQAQEATSSCCSTNKVAIENNPSSKLSSSDKRANHEQPLSFNQKLISGLKFSSTNLVKDISIWLMIGLFFAALIQTYLPASFLETWGSGIFAMLIMVLISIPMYICATASTPIAAALLLSGISPGAVLVFMMAGPATNIATLGVVYKELGKRSLIGYLSGVLGGALFFGWLTDYLVAVFKFDVVPLVGMEHQLLPESLTYLTGIILASLMLNELRKRIPLLRPSLAN
ncbi:putative permease [Marinomonas sp. MED121]|uniref:SO_0444 family Cu/Zn efflux transporter n=1 Tax=Marinomonas sp. MED121 TaxID=314277 RepID=UPI0000691071|nr:SO_0444 family Cu/Zn efflux transporter [Marinomonas sp. MED121]EAQ67362.1 putative permease [Marinomonas sp. MED121]